MRAVGRAAGDMIEEVRRQFRADPGIMAGTSTPDYTSCVDIAVRASLREMIAPGLLAVDSADPRRRSSCAGKAPPACS